MGPYHMRIVLIPSSYEPFTGGVEELTRNLACTLRDAGDQVEVWTANPGLRVLPKRSETDGITVRRFDFFLPGANAPSLLQFPVRACQTLVSLFRAGTTI